MRSLRFVVVFLPLVVGSIAAGWPGIDTGLIPVEAGTALPGRLPPGTWVRLRGWESPNVLSPEAVAATQRLRDAGIKPLAFLRWGGDSWKSQRPGYKGPHVPLDLREAFERARAYARAYGSAIAAWEFDNETDLGWIWENPEGFAAFHKAIYLGLKAGSKDRGISGAPVVGMSFGLPPGAYFQRLKANGYLSYLDGFNYHYYGYEEDFTAVGRAWEAAVTGRDGHGVPVGGERLGAIVGLEARGVGLEGRAFIWNSGRQESEGGSQADQSKIENRKSKMPGSLTPEDRNNPQSEIPNPQSPPGVHTRRLPVFLTEYGYGLLSPAARETAAGRVRHWRWNKSVGEQIRTLGFEGAMAFYLLPGAEANRSEWGLTVADSPGWARYWGAARERIPGQPVVGSPAPLKDGPVFVAGRLWFTPADFGATKAEPWMAGIGARVGRYEATPALAWLLDQAKQPYESRPWEIQAPAPSPVVIDLVVGPDARALKSWGGYVLEARGERREARGVGLEDSGRTTEGGGRLAERAPSAEQLAISPEGAVSGSVTELKASKGSSLKAAAAANAERVGSLQLPTSTSTGKGDAAVSLASAELRLYNFSDNPISGRLVIEAEDGAEIRPEGPDGPLGPVEVGSLSLRGGTDGGRTKVDGDRSAVGGAESVSGSMPQQKANDSALKAVPAAASAASAERVGSLHLPSSTSTGEGDAVSLAPGELRSLRVVLGAVADRYVARTVTVRFVPDDGGPVSVFSTRLIPDGTGMAPTVVERFNHPADSAKEARELLLTRPLASEEPRLIRQGQSRWLASKGTRIEDWGKVWRVVVTALPDEPVRPAMVELPLPPNRRWPMTALMRLSYRMTVGVEREPHNAAAMDIMFRTRNGNLFGVFPRIWAEKEWQHYAEPLENFGLVFFGRAAMPWRFEDNEPVALVIFMRPKTLPVTFEFANAEITSFAR